MGSGPPRSQSECLPFERTSAAAPTPRPRALSFSASCQVRWYSDPVQFEVEIYKNESGEWVATAVEHEVTAKGRTENEALSFLMEALSARFKKS